MAVQRIRSLMPDRIIDRIMPGEAVVPEQQISHLPAVTKLKLRPTSNIFKRPSGSVEYLLCTFGIPFNAASIILSAQ
jgi:hypothetical protein